MQLTMDFLKIFNFSLQPSRVAEEGGMEGWGVRGGRIMMDLDSFLGYCLGI